VDTERDSFLGLDDTQERQRLDFVRWLYNLRFMDLSYEAYEEKPIPGGRAGKASCGNESD
jgi:uncharacterized protein YfbU (UPF0304 family)